MDERRVVIISPHPIFAQAIARLVQRQAGVRVVGVAQTPAEARPLVQEHAPQTIIVDHDSAALGDGELFSLLQPDGTNRQIIFLTLSGNQMVIHHRERRENTTPMDGWGVIRAEYFQSAHPQVDQVLEHIELVAKEARNGGGILGLA